MTEVDTKMLFAEKHYPKSDGANASWTSSFHLKRTTWLLGIFQLVLIFLFAFFGGSEVVDPLNTPGTGLDGYNMWTAVAVMMFIGFGYLMTFLKWYGLGAVGFTMVITAMGLQWALFTQSFFNQLMTNYPVWQYVDLNIYRLLDCLYAISACLISFGALIGKISPYQLLVMTVIELACHSINYRIFMFGVLNVYDIGGTYVCHMFGAYFGLSVAYMLGKPKSEAMGGAVPDIFSFIGTLFLWIYWPSFVAGAEVADSANQERAIVNTILALASSTVIAFFLSSLFAHDGKYRPVDIQNATLAGGVAIGSTANLAMTGFGAIIIGVIAGSVSLIGYVKIQPYLEKRWGLHDTCGIHNLHAMPSVVGALASVFAALHWEQAGGQNIYGNTYKHQWWHQLMGIFLCIGFAVFSGLIVGNVLRHLNPTAEQFQDDVWWEVAKDYEGNVKGSDDAGADADVEAEAGAQGDVEMTASHSETSQHNGTTYNALLTQTTTA